MIKSWADEYDSDMDDEWKPKSPSLNNSNSIYDTSSCDKDTFYKFSDKICERKCTINYKLFSIVENSRYSCLMPWYVSQVNYFLKDTYIKPNISVNKIVDSGANIGVDSINFLINFPHSQLISFEIENKTYNALCNNLLEYKTVTKVISKEELTKSNNKVQAYNKDFLLNFDLIYNSDIVVGQPIATLVTSTFGNSIGQIILLLLPTLSSAALAFSTFLLGKEVINNDGGIFASAFIATSPAILSHSLQSLDIDSTLILPLLSFTFFTKSTTIVLVIVNRHNAR